MAFVFFHHVDFELFKLFPHFIAILQLNQFPSTEAQEYEQELLLPSVFPNNNQDFPNIN